MSRAPFVRRAIVSAVLAASLLQAHSPAGPAAPPSRSEKIKALPEEERKWLTEFVAPIIFAEEEKVFLELTEPYQREEFKREFWERRETQSLPYPLGLGYRVRYEELRRLADEKYDGWREDAGRMVLRYGEPASINKAEDCSQVFRDLEVWTYARIGLGGHAAGRHIFYRPSGVGPRRLWRVGTRDDEVFQPNSCRKRFAQLYRDCNPDPRDPCDPPVCLQACEVFTAWNEISRRQGREASAVAEIAQMFLPEPISLEGLDRIVSRYATISNPNAKKISIEGPSSVSNPPTTPAVKVSRSDRVKALPEEERKWLTEFVAPIILPEEERVFLELVAPYQREEFKQDFWARREKPGLIPPYGPGYRIRYGELRRLADEKYDGWKEDAGRMVLRYGEPTLIDEASGCRDVFRSLEIWTYLNLGVTGAGGARFLFYRPSPQAPRRMWKLGVRDDIVFQPNSCRKKFSDLHLDCEVISPQDMLAHIADKCHPPVCQQVCDVYYVWKEVSTRQRNSIGAEIEYARLFEPDKEISTEGLDRLKDRWATTSDPNAKTIGVEGPSSETRVAAPQESPAPTPTPVPAPHDLSREEIRERILLLEKKYRDWLDFSGPLMTEPELSRFLQMSNTQKDDFIRKFWKRHSGSG